MDRKSTPAANAATSQPRENADAATTTPDTLASLDALDAETPHVAHVEPEDRVTATDAPDAPAGQADPDDPEELEDFDDRDGLDDETPPMKPATFFRRMRGVTVADLISRPRPARVPIIADLIDPKTVGQIGGPAKTRKTFFALDLSMHVAAGVDWLGYNVPKPCRVLYVNFELDEDNMAKRLSTMCRGKIKLADLGDRLQIVNARGRTRAVREYLEAFPEESGIDLLVVDPLSSFLVDGEDENNADAMRHVCNIFSRIAERGPAVCVVCHDSKGDVSKRDVRDRVAGSSVLARTPDFRLVLTPVQDRVVAVESMLRNHDSRDPYSAEFDPSTCTFAPSDVLPIPAKYGQPDFDSKIESAVYEIVEANPDITASVLKTKAQIVTGKHESKVREIIRSLVERKYIDEWEDPKNRKGYPAKHYKVRAGRFFIPGGAANA